jgi:PAS domain S-box-containing protein
MNSTNKPIKLLLIEDDSVDRTFFQRALKASDIVAELTIAEDGAAGITDFCNGDFDCVFLDYMLPGTDGMSLLRSLHEKKAGVPIVLVTSHGDEKIAVNAMKAGATDYIPKNLITPSSLAQIIRSILRFKEIERQKIHAENIVRQNERRHRIFFEKSQIFLCTHDLDGNFINVNMAGAKSLGYVPEELIGTNLKDIVSPEHMHLFDSYLEKILQEKTIMGLMHVLTKTNEERIWMYHNYLYEESDNEENYVIGSIQDITERVKMEEAMRVAKLLAEDSVKIKEQFLANMSHEIRTPMSAILGFTDLILETKLDNEQRSFLDTIHHSAKNLLSIINDILDFSKISSGKLSLEEADFDLSKLTRTLVQTFQLEAAKKNIRLICNIQPEVPLILKGDSVRLNQILLNLFSNALKFTESGSVRLEIGLLDKKEGVNTIAFSVEDTGIGIPPDKLESIFESFTQASSDTTRKYGGTGLGLAIVKNLVELYGGSITAANMPGQGAKLTFTIAVKSGSAAGEESSAIGEQEKSHGKKYCDLNGTRILVVEDNTFNQLLAERVLYNMHAVVDIASNGREAIEKLRTATYDIILMDIQMPEMDGYEATRHIRMQFPEGLNKIPIIAMTAHALSDEGSRCILAGMNDYISKPFEPYNLGAKIKNLLIASGKMPDQGISGEPSLAVIETKSEERMDLSTLKEMLGDGETLTQILLTMCHEMQEQNNSIKASLEEENWEQLSRIAHKMKSCVMMLKMPRFLTVVELTEKRAQAGTSLETLPELVEEILWTSYRTIDALRSELALRPVATIKEELQGDQNAA